MNRLSLVPFLLLVACGPKGGAATPAPISGDGAAAEPAPAEAPLPIIDAGQVCGERGTAYVLEAVWPEGCPGPNNPYAAEQGEFQAVTEFEFQLDVGTTGMSYMGVLDMGTNTVAYQPNGCAARVRMTGDDGELVITWAAADSESLQVTGRWNPRTGTGCDVAMTGRHSTY